jgi:hypothetical protein
LRDLRDDFLHGVSGDLRKSVMKNRGTCAHGPLTKRESVPHKYAPFWC